MNTTFYRLEEDTLRASWAHWDHEPLCSGGCRTAAGVGGFLTKAATLAAAACLLVIIAPLGSADAAPVQLLSMRNPSVLLPAGGNGNSAAPSISPDGRFVVFASSANDLVPGGNSRPVLNVFLRDRTWNTTTLVSANSNGTGGGDDDSMFGQLSSSGRYVVFQSDASDLVPGDTNGVSDIFLRDVLTGTTLLVSVATDGGFGNGASTDPVMTPDGTCVVFVSTASNLVAGDTNAIPDVFVRDLITQTTHLVSVGAVAPSGSTSAAMATPMITQDGRFVAFRSTAVGLVPGLPNSPNGEVFVRDLLAGTTIWASTNAAALLSAAYGYDAHDNASYHPRVSSDGRYVVFKTGSTNPVNVQTCPTTLNPVLVLQYDAATATTTVISTNGWGVISEEDDAFGPEMTPDGRYVVYAQSEGTSFQQGYPNYPPYSSVHVWDSETDQDTLVSRDANGVPTNTYSRAPLISPNGRFVAFLSNATNLVGSGVSNGFHLYRSDLVSNITQLVDVDTNGMGTSDDELACSSMSASGRFIAFSSPDGGLVDLDKNDAYDVFVRDIQQGTNELISRRDPTVIPATGDASSSLSQLSVSADGRWVAFASLADDLVPNDTNNCQDVFVYDLLRGSNTLVSVASDGRPALGGWSASAIISANGRFVAFISTATNLVAGQATNTANVFLRDLQASITTLVSVSTNGVSPANADCHDPSISQDGRYVIFSSTAGNLAAGTRGGDCTFWRDAISGTTEVLTNFQNSSPFASSMSRDGRYVAYYYCPWTTAEKSLRVQDTQLATDIYTNAWIVSSLMIGSASLSPDGKHLVYLNAYGTYANILFVDDVATGTNVFGAKSTSSIRNSAEWSGDGRFLAFVSTTNLLGGDDNINKLFLCDLLSNSITLVNANVGPAGSLSPWFDSPAMSGDGRFVAYRTPTNSFPWVTNAPPYVFLFDRLTVSNSVLDVGQPGSSPVSWVSRPAISGSGGTIAFLSMGSGLVSGDLNNVQDAFAAAVDIGTVLDSGGDGIPDWWRILYFGHATGEASDLSRATDDADGDGMSNWQEWIAGTIPTDPSSRLILVTPTWNETGLTLSWESVSGVTYCIQRSSGVSGESFSIIESNIVGQAGSTSFTDTNTAGSRAFLYRVGVQ